jgi:hypothetical protein
LELDPTETFPKATVARLALSAAGAIDVEFAAFVVVVVAALVVVEPPFALVTPAQPERIAAENKSVPERNRIRTRGRGRAQVWRET